MSLSIGNSSFQDVGLLQFVKGLNWYLLTRIATVSLCAMPKEAVTMVRLIAFSPRFGAAKDSTGSILSSIARSRGIHCLGQLEHQVLWMLHH